MGSLRVRVAGEDVLVREWCSEEVRLEPRSEERTRVNLTEMSEDER